MGFSPSTSTTISTVNRLFNVGDLAADMRDSLAMSGATESEYDINAAVEEYVNAVDDIIERHGAWRVGDEIHAPLTTDTDSFDEAVLREYEDLDVQPIIDRHTR